MTCVYLAAAVAVVLAWIVAGSHRGHRPVAFLLSGGILVRGSLLLWDAYVLAPLRASLGLAQPWEGWPRVAGIIADALAFTWPAAFVGTALVVFAGRRPWPAVLGWLAVTSGTIIAHPIGNDGRSVGWIGVIVAVFLFARWCRKSKGRSTGPQLLLAIVIANDIAALAIPTQAGEQLVNFGMFGLLVAMLTYRLIRHDNKTLESELAKLRGTVKDAAECANDAARTTAAASKLARTVHPTRDGRTRIGGEGQGQREE